MKTLRFLLSRIVQTIKIVVARKMVRPACLLTLILACNSSTMGQQKILAMSVDAIPPAGDTLMFGIPKIDSTTMYTVSMNIILTATDSIYRFHVKLGETLHGTEKLSAFFDYGISGTHGNTSYSQTGNSILLGLGSFVGLSNFFAEVQVEKTDHSLEDIVLFSNQ